MNDGSMWERYQDGTYFNPERAILTDLIAELRKPGHSYGHYLYETGWEDGVQDSMLRATQYERILTDLIAELRVMGGEYDSGWAPLIPVADRAEARLREVQGE